MCVRQSCISRLPVTTGAAGLESLRSACRQTLHHVGFDGRIQTLCRSADSAGMCKVAFSHYFARIFIAPDADESKVT